MRWPGSLRTGQPRDASPATPRAFRPELGSLRRPFGQISDVPDHRWLTSNRRRWPRSSGLAARVERNRKTSRAGASCPDILSSFYQVRFCWHSTFHAGCGRKLLSLSRLRPVDKPKTRLA